MARRYSTRWRQLKPTSETRLSYLELACACLCPHPALCSTWGSVAPAGVVFIAQLILRLVCLVMPIVWTLSRLIIHEITLGWDSKSLHAG